jgi:uncharacterized Ntn-hydrolase superfamily protein
VARDATNGDLGVAVQSKFFGVGAVVPWAEAGTGAVATQAYANTTYGPRGLAFLREGASADAAGEKLLAGDPAGRDERQLAIVDAAGRIFHFTGKRCREWAGSRAGEGFSVQGNLLVSEAVIAAMAEAFTRAKGELAERLVAALAAGEGAGGDVRGRQSAALLVVRRNGGYGAFNDRYVDLRVDDHPDPIGELGRLLAIQLGKDPLTTARRLERQEHRDEALEVLRRAAGVPPFAAAARFEAARILLALGRKEEALREISAALGTAPGHDHHHFQAARLFAEHDLGAEALEALRATLKLNPEYARVLERESENPASPFRGLRKEIGDLLKGTK